MTDDALKIRAAVAEDIEAVTHLVVAAFAPYAAQIGKMPAPALYNYAELIATGRVRLAVDGGQRLGVIYAYPEADGAVMLDVLAVSEAARGRGIARRLIAEIEDEARGQGVSRLRVYTNEVMSGPQILYPKLRYRETHRSQSDGYSRIHYEKVL